MVGLLLDSRVAAGQRRRSMALSSGKQLTVYEVETEVGEYHCSPVHTCTRHHRAVLDVFRIGMQTHTHPVLRRHHVCPELLQAKESTAKKAFATSIQQSTVDSCRLSTLVYHSAHSVSNIPPDIRHIFPADRLPVCHMAGRQSTPGLELLMVGSVNVGRSRCKQATLSSR